jgi:hypothetical protein
VQPLPVLGEPRESLQQERATQELQGKLELQDPAEVAKKWTKPRGGHSQ